MIGKHRHQTERTTSSCCRRRA